MGFRAIYNAGIVGKSYRRLPRSVSLLRDSLIQLLDRRQDVEHDRRAQRGGERVEADWPAVARNPIHSILAGRFGLDAERLAKRRDRVVAGSRLIYAES